MQLLASFVTLLHCRRWKPWDFGPHKIYSELRDVFDVNVIRIANSLELCHQLLVVEESNYPDPQIQLKLNILYALSRY